MISPMSAAGRSYDAGVLEPIVTPDVTTFVVGDVVMLPIDSDGRYTTCTTPTAAGIGTTASSICSDGVFGVVKTVFSTTRLRVTVIGYCQATALSTSNAAIAVDAPFFVNTSKQLELDHASADTNKKWVALAAASAAGGGTSTPALRSVFFNGLTGFGRYPGTAS